MKVIRRPWQWLLLGGAILVLLTLLFAPIRGTAQRAGSSYSRAPDGYGAWYHYMQAQPQVCIGRWHQSIGDLKRSGTLIQVFPNLASTYLSDAESQWVNRGNTLIRLGVETAIADAPFSSALTSPQGTVTIETRRRREWKLLDSNVQKRLSDPQGAIVWQWAQGKGTVIVASTPYLGANAYQNQPGNFKLLAALATPDQGAIWMDETRFGYRPSQQAALQADDATPLSSSCEPLLAQAKPLQPDTSSNGIPPDPFLYLLRTPLGLVILQAFVVAILVILSKNRRFGLPLPLEIPQSDNTLSYIQALATVLHKARCHGFVVAAIQQAEQRSLQQHLGLGTVLLDPTQVLDIWQRIGYPPDLLNRALIHPPANQCREQDLLTWLEAWQQVRAALSLAGSPAAKSS